MKRIEYIAFGVIAAFITLGIFFSHTNEEFFLNHYVQEDGPLEWSTVVMLIAAGCMMFARAIRLRGKRTRLFLTVTACAGLVLFFGAGEEISWGQRLFGIETPELLATHNKQRETNFHNLELGGVNVNKLVFSNLLGLGLVFYILILPTLATRKPAIASLTVKFAIPLPRKRQILVWVLAMALPELLVATGKKAEVAEACAGMIVFVTLMNPRNRFIYDPERSLET